MPSSEDSVGSELVLERTFNAPVALVWKAWTQAEHLMAWWGPKHHPATEMRMDLTVGGTWRACLRSVEDGRLLWMNGIIREIVPHERLVFTFQWEEEGERGLETVVSVAFTEEYGATRMVFRQVPFRSVTERDGHTEGWSSCFDRLQESALLCLPAGDPPNL